MEIEFIKVSSKHENEEEKNVTNYSGNYEENLEKYLKIFTKKHSTKQIIDSKSLKNISCNPFPLNSVYLRKRKSEYYFIWRRSFKKIKGLFYSSKNFKYPNKEKICSLLKMNRNCSK